VRYFKLALLALSAIAVLLCFVYNIFKFGGQGAFTFAMCAGPMGLAGFFTAKPPMPRWASISSAVALLIVGMKTSGDDTDINNIMMAAFFGMIMAVILAIRPERAR